MRKDVTPRAGGNVAGDHGKVTKYNSAHPIKKVCVDLRIRTIQNRRTFLDKKAHLLIKECVLDILHRDGGSSTEDHLYARVLAVYPEYFPFLRKALNTLARTGSGRVVSHLEHGERIYELAEVPA